MKARKPLALILSAAMILSMLSLSAFAAEGETAPALADAESSWAAESINRWAKAGIVQGDSDGNFNPAKPLSRAELATIFVKMFGLTEKADNTTPSSSARPPASCRATAPAAGPPRRSPAPRPWSCSAGPWA